MKNYFGYVICLCSFLLLVSISSSCPPARADNSDRYFESLQIRLIKDGFDKDRIRALYSRPQVNFETQGVSRFLIHREATLNYDQFVSPAAIQRARRYLKAHKHTFERIEQIYGVDKEVITAIILVETQLGTSMGGPPTLNILSTLGALSDPIVQEMFWKKVSTTVQVSKAQFKSWVKKKSNWAYAELKSFLIYTAKAKIDPLAVSGSYAGAIGIAQFIPSSILSFGKDGNNDGRIDLAEHADAIASIANYLKHYGWVAGIDKRTAQKVIFHYNHSNYYVDTILKITRLLTNS
jgi:peptidoglycan lytic transglycosylase B